MYSKLARIFSTFTFRLALVYVSLFSLSVVVLFAFIYTFAVRYLENQTADAIKLQYNYLLNEYHENGSTSVAERIRELIAKDEEGTEIYLLVNRDYEKLSGNLNEWPTSAIKDASFEKEGSWVRFHIESARGNPNGIEVKALAVPISKWRMLLVGQSLQNNQKIEQTIIQTFWASLLLTFIMALIGAIIMTRSVMGRLGVINRSAQTIMHGNISARIPFTRGGDEFDELSSNLNQMLDKIEMLLLSLSQFANNIAHDLRSPLNRIINRLDAGLRSIDRQNPAHRLLQKNIKDMEELVATFNSILKISELEAGTDISAFEPCDLRDILLSLTELYEPLALEKRITLLCEIRSALPIRAEKNLLSQAFANLIDNAIKFTPEGGRVTIGCETAPGEIAITIADSGPGVPAQYYDKVFEKFFRLEQSRGSKGNGLGLSLVAAIARIHGAKISLEENHPGLKVRIAFHP